MTSINVLSSSDEEVEWVPPPPLNQRINKKVSKLKRRSTTTTKNSTKSSTNKKQKISNNSKKLVTNTHVDQLSPVPSPPILYGTVPDHAIVRRFYLRRDSDSSSVTINQVKRSAIQHFKNGEMYEPNDITLFAGRPPKEIRSQNQLDAALSYPGCFHILSGPPDVVGIVAASVYDDWPSSLFIAPLSWPVTTACLQDHSQCHYRKTGRTKQPNRIKIEDMEFLRKM